MPVSITLMGGLGNQLFQIAAVLGYTLKHGLDHCIPSIVVNPHYPLSPDQDVYKFPGINYCHYEAMAKDKMIFWRKYLEVGFHYEQIPQFNVDNVTLSGYFQSFKYLEGHREQILKAFGFDDIVTIPDTCAIHIRLGDYKIYSDHHPVVSKEYIAVAIGNMWFKGYKKFIVFSDEIEEAKEIIASITWFRDHISFEYSEGKGALEDLRLMASCASIITGNSTLSLWAAYINPNPDKIVISPQRWFGEAANHDTKDLYLPNSTIL